MVAAHHVVSIFIPRTIWICLIDAALMTCMTPESPGCFQLEHWLPTLPSRNTTS